MSDTVPPPAPDATPPARQRNPLERLVVWGGIVILLVVLGWEWSAKNGYSSSMNDLETAIGDMEHPLSVADIDAHIHGYAVRGESAHPQFKLVTLEWPSLFKEYHLNVAVDDQGRVRSVETEMPQLDTLDEVRAEAERIRASAGADAGETNPGDTSPSAPSTDAAP